MLTIDKFFTFTRFGGMDSVPADEYDAVCKKLQIAVALLESRERDHESVVQDLNDVIEDLDCDATTYKALMKKREESISLVMEENDKLWRRNEQLQDTIDAMEIDNAFLRGELDHAENQRDELKLENIEIRFERDTLRAAYDAIRAA